MKCKQCGADNPEAKKCCTECGAFLEGWTHNNVNGKYGYRGADGRFYESEEAYKEHLSVALPPAGERSLFANKAGQHIPIRNFPSDAIPAEFKQRADEYMRSIGVNTQFVGDDALVKLQQELPCAERRLPEAP